VVGTDASTCCAPGIRRKFPALYIVSALALYIVSSPAPYIVSAWHSTSSVPLHLGTLQR